MMIGKGTKVVRERPDVTVLPKSPNDGRTDPEITWVRIVQRLTLSFDAPCYVGGGASQRDCMVCGKKAPLPDDVAAQFILENNDGPRIHFPDAHDCRQERDRYPVAGWQDRNLVNDRHGLVCGECCTELDKATKEVVERLAIKSGPKAP